MAAEIPPELVMLLWAKIDVRMLANPNLDYLQVFNLDMVDELPNIQIITHTQERPKYEHETHITAQKAVYSKVFVIDSGEYSTMMLASEY